MLTVTLTGVSCRTLSEVQDYVRKNRWYEDEDDLDDADDADDDVDYVDDECFSDAVFLINMSST
jgi:hypothetical protein